MSKGVSVILIDFLLAISFAHNNFEPYLSPSIPFFHSYCSSRSNRSLHQYNFSSCSSTIITYFLICTRLSFFCVMWSSTLHCSFSIKYNRFLSRAFTNDKIRSAAKFGDQVRRVQKDTSHWESVFFSTVFLCYKYMFISIVYL